MLTYMLWMAVHLASVRYIPNSTAAQYIKEIEHQADRTGVSSITFVTIITHESQWLEQAVSADGLDMGLMQVRKTYYPGKPEWLLNGVNNIKAGAVVINRSVEMCRKFLGREPEMQEWLACYTGSCRNKSTMCKPTHLTQQFENYQQCLTLEMTGSQTKSECQKHFYH